MDREEQRPAARGVRAQRRGDIARLAQIEPSNGSSMSSTGCGVSRPIASSARFRWPFDSVPIGRCSKAEIELIYHFFAEVARPQENRRIRERPSNGCPTTARFCREYKTEGVGPRRSGTPAGIRRQHARQTLEQG